MIELRRKGALRATIRMEMTIDGKAILVEGIFILKFTVLRREKKS